jgi:hypothetical protein
LEGEEAGVDDLAVGYAAYLNGYFKRPADGKADYGYEGVGLSWKCVCTAEISTKGNL